MRTINAAGLQIIKDCEGFRAKAYQDAGGLWTLGWGHTGGVKEGDTCSQTQADQWLGEDIHTAEQAVCDLITVPLTDNQFSALVSFTFEEGRGRLAGSTLRLKLNSGEYGTVPAYLRSWVFANGHVQPGLVKRRAAEGALWSEA